MKILKKVAGVFCLLMVLGGVAATAQEQEPGLLAIVVVFALLAWLCFRKSKKREQKAVHKTEVSTPLVTVTTERTAPEVPDEILQDMRRYYTAVQAENDTRIMGESFKLCQQTGNIDTFCSRLELAQRCALTLLQAKKAGCPGISRSVEKTCTDILASLPTLKSDLLSRTYIKETTDALLLKTPAGKRKRMEAYISKLAEHEATFDDVRELYEKTIKDTRALMP